MIAPQVNQFSADVIIVGAGLVGASLALLLARKTSLTVALIEAGNELELSAVPQADSKLRGLRVSALGHTAKSILSDIGIWENLSITTAYQKMVVWDDYSDAEIVFDGIDSPASDLGHIVDNTECVARLHKAVQDCANVHCYFNALPSELIEDGQGTVIRFSQAESGQHEIRSFVAVACDGRNSWLRKQAEIPSKTYDYQQKGIVALVKAKDAQFDTAWQNFLATGPLALLPYSEDLFSIVWSADNVFAESLLSMTDSEFSDQLEQAMGSRLGTVELVSKRLSFPLSSQLAERFVKKRIVLVGDAAHSIHPLAGQGANLGFKDAQLLCSKLCQAERGLDDVKTLSDLRDYAKQRKLDADLTDKLMTGFHLCFTSSAWWMLPLRSGAIAWVNSNPFLKKHFVSLALGEA